MKFCMTVVKSSQDTVEETVMFNGAKEDSEEGKHSEYQVSHGHIGTGNGVHAGATCCSRTAPPVM